MTCRIFYGMAILTVIDIQKINTVRSENVDGDREKCIKEAVMTAKVEEMCLRDEADQQPADASFNSKIQIFFK